MSALRRALRYTGYGTIAALPPTYCWYVNASGDYFLQGAWRGIYFWARTGPIVAKYILVDKKTRNSSAEERNAAFSDLHVMYAPTALSIILALRGFYIKVGQFATTRSDLVPQEYIDQFRTLQDSVPHEDVAYVKKTIQDTLGKPTDEIFSYIEPEPLGAASIGQAHYARLHDGSEVVVKVQYPGVKNTFYMDMSCIRTVLTLVEPSLGAILDELRKQFLTEFDYRGEAKNLKDVAEAVLPKWKQCVDMPQPIPHLCGEHALTMTYIPGEKLETVLRKEWQRLGFKEEDLQIRMQTTVPPSPLKLACMLRFLHLSAAIRGMWDSCLHALDCIRATFTGHEMPARLPRTRIPRRQHLLQTLLGVHAQGVLIDGMFNADLHPGNFLLMPDGRIGLIDFGQVKRIDSATRKKVAELIVAIATKDTEATVHAYTSLGVRSKKMDSAFLEANAKILFGRIDSDLTGGRPLLDFLKDLKTWDTLTVVPGEIYLPARAATMLRGLAMLLKCQISVADEWRTVAQSVLKQVDS